MPSGKTISSFLPERCPWRACEFFRRPAPFFCIRWGSYKPDCRRFTIPRFRCKGCRRTFSYQTFRADYRLRKPHLTRPLLRDFVSGVSQRQCARTLGIARKTVEDRLWRMGRHFEIARKNLLRGWEAEGEYQFDEIETYEHNRILKPLTVGLLVERSSGTLVETSVGRLRSRAGKSSQSQERRERFEKREGQRPYESPRIVKRCLKRLKRGKEIVIVTDKKTLYGRVIEELFRGRGVEHRAVAGKGSKGPESPLFGVNHMAAKVRYGISRLIRRSWCVSKRRRHLRWHLAMYGMWHNGWRWKTNPERRTPGMAGGTWGRRLGAEEMFGWRQDWGKYSRRVGAPLDGRAEEERGGGEESRN